MPIAMVVIPLKVTTSLPSVRPSVGRRHRKIDDRKATVRQPDAAVGVNPFAPAVRAARSHMVTRAEELRSLDGIGGIVVGEYAVDTAHLSALVAGSGNEGNETTSCPPATYLTDDTSTRDAALAASPNEARLIQVRPSSAIRARERSRRNRDGVAAVNDKNAVG
jgi:hypothetical protein